MLKHIIYFGNVHVCFVSSMNEKNASIYTCVDLHMSMFCLVFSFQNNSLILSWKIFTWEVLLLFRMRIIVGGGIPFFVQDTKCLFSVCNCHRIKKSDDKQGSMLLWNIWGQPY